MIFVYVAGKDDRDQQAAVQQQGFAPWTYDLGPLVLCNDDDDNGVGGDDDDDVNDDEEEDANDG